MEVTTDRRSVQQCLEQRYALPTYQRDYKWELKHLRELLEDIQEIFFNEFDRKHGRAEVNKYEKYFLGTIITIPAEEGRKAIVDGQQRITTLALIVMHFYRLSVSRPDLEISDIGTLLRKKLFGVSQYNMEFSPPRALLFDTLCDANLDGVALDEAVEKIENLDEGAKRMYESFRHVHTYISDQLEDSAIPYFVDYLTQCVNLFEIGVPSEQTGHKVFVTMNDRGLKLGPLDLLKGYLLSNITVDAENSSAHTAWKLMLSKLQALGQDEDSSFFKNWLRAQHAESIRGKQKDAPPGDFELAADTYHRWVEAKAADLGLGKSDEYFQLITIRLPFFAKHYATCLEGESTFSSEFPALYFNGRRDLTLQSMIVLAVLDPADTNLVASTKIKLVSHYLDCYATYRYTAKQDNTYNNLRDPLFDLAKQIRRKPLTELVAILEKSYDSFAKQPISLASITYNTETPILLHILARVADFLERELELVNRVGFPSYVQRGKTNSTFDVEHLLPSNVEITQAELAENFDFASDAEYSELRNSLAGLILLTRGRNRSLKGKPFSEKLTAYATESVMAQAFCDSFYTNNPQPAGHIKRLGIDLTAMPFVNKAALLRRAKMYDAIAQSIWDKSHFSRIAEEAKA